MEGWSRLENYTIFGAGLRSAVYPSKVAAAYLFK
jgi:hypothetical protein